jgi:hypothetical protein
MAVALTIENLTKIQKILKNAQRASRAVIYSASGETEPEANTGTIASIRSAILASADTTVAAKAIIDLVSDYVL